MKFRISSKISMLVGALSAAVSITIGLVLHYGSTEIIFDQSLERLKYETNIRSVQLLNDIEGLSLDALYLVGTPPISGIPRSEKSDGIDPLDGSTTEVWVKRLEIIFAELIRAKPTYIQIRLIPIRDGGRELVRVDKLGNLIQSIAQKDLQQKGDKDYFKKAAMMNPGEVHLSNISLNREYGKVTKPHLPTIRAATPIYYNNELYGVLVINMDFRSIFKSLIDSTPRSLTPYVTNEQGFYLANPEISKSFGFDLGHDEKIYDLYPSLNFNKTQDIRDSEFTFFENQSNDLNVIHVVKAQFDSSNRERFLGVALATSNANLLSESNKLRNNALIVVALLVAGILLVSSALATRLMRPLQKITNASEDVANGREVMDLPIHDNDEIGDLARAFDLMRTQLNDKEKALLETQAESHHENKMASLGEMASGMAHEINTPLQEISLIAERVKRRSAKGKMGDINEPMDQVLSNVKHMSSIIESLRKVSRQSEDDPFELSAVEDIISDVTNLSKERYFLKGVKLEVIYAGECRLLKIECQRLQISQILINLVNNAFDSVVDSSNKWIKINIDTEDNNLKISVTDGGFGISTSVQHKMFEPMYTTKSIGHGTGLGLSISAGIAEKHGGNLSYDKSCKNTCFILTLPLQVDNT